MPHYYASWRFEIIEPTCNLGRVQQRNSHKFNARQTIWRLKGGWCQGKKISSTSWGKTRRNIECNFICHTLYNATKAAKQQSVWRTAGWIMEMHHIIPQLLLLQQDSLLQDGLLQDNLLRNVWERACNYATYCLFALGTATARRTRMNWEKIEGNL